MRESPGAVRRHGIPIAVHVAVVHVWGCDPEVFAAIHLLWRPGRNLPVQVWIRRDDLYEGSGDPACREELGEVVSIVLCDVEVIAQPCLQHSSLVYGAQRLVCRRQSTASLVEFEREEHRHDQDLRLSWPEHAPRMSKKRLDKPVFATVLREFALLAV